MKISLVIPVYNGLEHLRRNLASVVKLHPDELIAVDDASTDGSADYLAQHYPEIKLLRHVTNTGFPRGANDGVAAATGDLVILLNQDVLPVSLNLSDLKAHFSDPQLFAVTFNETERSWAQANFHHGFLQFKNGPPSSTPHPSFWASGGGSVFRKSMWDQLGGFDLIFTPGYFEDLDLGWRAHRQGWQILWDPRLKIDHTHHESAFSSAHSSTRLIRTKERNYLLAHWKNLSASHLFIHLIALCLRCLRHPGFIRPTLAALVKLPQVISFRLHA